MQTSQTRKTLTSVPTLAQGRAWELDSCVRAGRKMASYFRCLPSILPQGSHAESGNPEGKASFS